MVFGKISMRLTISFGDHTENSFRRVIMPIPQLLWIEETAESLLVHEMMGEGELQELKSSFIESE